MKIRNLVLGANAGSGTKGSVYLGRPWGDYARVIFQNSNLGNMITSVGWEGTSCHVSCFFFPCVHSLFSLLFVCSHLLPPSFPLAFPEHFLHRGFSIITELTNPSLGFLTIDVQHPFWRVCQHQCWRNESLVGEGIDKCRGYFIYSVDIFELG